MTQQVGVSLAFDDVIFRQNVVNYLQSIDKMMKETRKASGEIVKSSQNVEKQTQKTAKATEVGAAQASAALKTLRSTLTTLVPVATFSALALGVKNFTDDSLQQFQSFEFGMREVFTLMPDISQAAMDQMEDDILDLGIEYGRMTEETVPALYQAISAGVPRENVMEFLVTASEAARGGVATLETAVDVLTTIVNAYGEATITAQEASDLLFTAVQGGKVTFDQLAASAFNVVPLAAALGVEFRDVTSAIAAMTKQGVPARTATTQLRQVLANLSQEGRKASEIFKEAAGVSFTEFIAQGNNLEDAMRILDAETQRMNVSAADLFGNIRAGQGALVLTGEGLNIFAREMERSEDATGAMAEASDTVSDSLEFFQQQSAAAKQAMKVQIGEGLAPLKKAWLELEIQIYSTIEAQQRMANETRDVAKENEDLINDLRDLITESGDFTGLLDDMGQRLSATNTILRVFEMQLSGYANTTEEAEQMQRALNASMILIETGFSDNAQVIGETAVQLANYQQEIINNVGPISDLDRLQRLLNDDMVEGAEVVGEYEELVETLASTVANYTIKMLDANDGQEEFNKLLFGLAEEAEFGIDAIIELAESTKSYTEEELELARVLAETEQARQNKLITMEEENKSINDIIMELQAEYGPRIRAAQAAVDQANASDKLIEKRQKEIDQLPTLIDLLEQSRISMGGFFAEALENKDEAGFFTKDLEDLGEQFVTLNGRTVDQQEVLNDLRDAYERTEEQIRDYEIGVKSATEEDDKRAEKLEELRGDLVSLDAAMQPLLDIQGEVVMVNNMAVVSQDALNDALFEAAIAAEADAATLALLAGQLGLFTDAEVEAALKAAVLQEKIGAVAAEIASGETSIGDAIDELGRFADNLDRDFEIIVETGDLDAKMLETTTDAGEFMDRLTEHKMQIEENMGLAEEEVAGNATDISTALETTRTEIMETEKEWDTKVGEMRATVSEDFPAMATIVDTETQAAMLAVNTTTAQMATATAENVGQIPPTFDAALTESVNLIAGRTSDFGAVGLDIALGMAQGVRSGSGALAAAVAEIVANALATAEATAGVESPSIYMWEIGEDFVQGFIEGVRAKQPDVEQTTEEIFRSLIDLTSSIASAGLGFADMFTESTLDPMLDQIATIDTELLHLEEMFTFLGRSAQDTLDFADIAPFLIDGSQIEAAERYNALLEQRTGLSDDYFESQLAILELEKQQANLAFLQDQLELLDLLEEAGLGAAEILEGITLGVGADTEDLLAATSAVVNALVNQINAELGIAIPGGSSEVMEGVGEGMIDGLGKGVEDGLTNTKEEIFFILDEISRDAESLSLSIEEFFENLDASVESPIDAFLELADALESAGRTFARMFDEQFLDPLQDTIDETDDAIDDLLDVLTDGIDDRQDDLIDSLQTIFDLDEDEIIGQLGGLIDFAAGAGMDEVLADLQELEAILALNLEDEDLLAQLPELIAIAEAQGLTDYADALQEIYDLQIQRNEAEAEFAAEQERILELQRQQQQLDFLQTQLDLIRSLQEAGLDPNAILEGITLGLDASLPDLIDAMNAALEALIEQAEDDLGIESPSKVFEAMGEQIGAGLTKGIENSIIGSVGLENSIHELTSALSQPIITSDLSAPFSSAPILSSQASNTLNFNMGGVSISSEMDQVMFEEKIRRVVTDAI